VCIAQSDYYRILTQGKSNIKVIEEGGEVVMVTEHRSTDGGNREGEVVIKVRDLMMVMMPVDDDDDCNDDDDDDDDDDLMSGDDG